MHETKHKRAMQVTNNSNWAPPLLRLWLRSRQVTLQWQNVAELAVDSPEGQWPQRQPKVVQEAQQPQELMYHKEQTRSDQHGRAKHGALLYTVFPELQE